jgi:ribosomal protein RSM22 (predicted rRNA methylase)
MRLPDRLRDAIENETLGTGIADLSRASSEITERYKDGRFSQAPLHSAVLRHAYLHVRMPATFAANLRAFCGIHAVAPDLGLRSMLDLGAGPGTAMWAAAHGFPDLERFTLVERDGELSEIGRRLAFEADNSSIRTASWVRQDMSSDLSLERHDLVVISYALGELTENASTALLRRAWMLAGKLLVVIEPGTPRNFQRVLEARTLLLQLGAHIVAPCPHPNPCPLAATGDWCHFSQRLERTSAHRKLKGGALGYEDEKFSYVAAAKTPVQLPDARIVRHPGIHSGHVRLTLCTPEGLQHPTVGKSSKEEYRAARGAEWGDAWTVNRSNP